GRGETEVLLVDAHHLGDGPWVDAAGRGHQPQALGNGISPGGQFREEENEGGSCPEDDEEEQDPPNDVADSHVGLRWYAARRPPSKRPANLQRTSRARPRPVAHPGDCTSAAPPNGETGGNVNWPMPSSMLPPPMVPRWQTSRVQVRDRIGQASRAQPIRWN